jgi:RimJ/RimL family protein N-acetyltransferase
VTHVITLIPLSPEYHAGPLQHVYRSVPSFWQMYGLHGVPDGQAARDLVDAESTQGRTMMGIVRRLQEDDPQAGLEMVGQLDFRLHWPREGAAYIGMLMVAESVQRQGIGSDTWRLLADWLSTGTSVDSVRLGVEQFNPAALSFFQTNGFALTGDTNRIRVGEKWIRLLYMEQNLYKPPDQHSGQQDVQAPRPHHTQYEEIPTSQKEN